MKTTLSPADIVVAILHLAGSRSGGAPTFLTADREVMHEAFAVLKDGDDVGLLKSVRFRREHGCRVSKELDAALEELESTGVIARSASRRAFEARPYVDAVYRDRTFKSMAELGVHPHDVEKTLFFLGLRRVIVANRGGV